MIKPDPNTKSRPAFQPPVQSGPLRVGAGPVLHEDAGLGALKDEREGNACLSARLLALCCERAHGGMFLSGFSLPGRSPRQLRIETDTLHLQSLTPSGARMSLHSFPDQHRMFGAVVPNCSDWTAALGVMSRRSGPPCTPRSCWGPNAKVRGSLSQGIRGGIDRRSQT